MSSLGIMKGSIFYGRKSLAETGSIDTSKSVSSEHDPDKLPFLAITGNLFSTNQAFDSPKDSIRIMVGGHRLWIYIAWIHLSAPLPFVKTWKKSLASLCLIFSSPKWES